MNIKRVQNYLKAVPYACVITVMYACVYTCMRAHMH